MVHELQVETSQMDGVEVITLGGAVEQLNFPSLAATLGRSIHERTPCIVLDCRHVNYIGSTQLRELLEFAAYARTRGGDIKCVGLAPAIRNVAGLVSTNGMFDCHETIPGAVGAFRETEPHVTV